MAKRANGEGSKPRKRKDGRWEVRVTVGYDKRGQPKRKSLYGKTQREVVRQAQDLQNKLNLGMVAKHDRISLEAFAKLWLEFKKPDLKPSTYSVYKDAFKRFAPLHKRQLDKISAAHIDALYRQLLADGLSVTSIQITHRAVKSSFKQAIKWDMLTRNVFDNVTLPRQQKKEMSVWDAQDITRFVAFAKGHRLYPLFHLALATGMRRGELLALEWSDVDFVARTVTVNRSAALERGNVIVQQPKTAASRRTIHVTEGEIEVLQGHRAKLERERQRLGEAWAYDSLVFPSQVGTYLVPRNVTRTFDHIIKQAGIQRIRFHDLRHTHASMLIKHKQDPKVISERLGHTNVAFTQNTYQHLYDEQRQEAALGLTDILS